MGDHARESTLPFEPPRMIGDETAATSDDRRPHGGEGLGRVERIWIKRAKRGPMDAVERAMLDADRGIRGNANRGGRRQVTIIARERWDAIMATLGLDLDPSTRRANLMISGLDLEKSRGRILRIGNVRLRIN